MTNRNRPPGHDDRRPPQHPRQSAQGHLGHQGYRGPPPQANDPRVQRAMAARAAEQGRRRPPPKKSGGGALSFLLYAFLGLVILLGAGIFYLTIAPPTGFIREQAVAAVKDKTGRTLRMAGNPQITFFPALGVALKDVRLSAPPGMSAPDFLKAKSVTVAVSALPLLSGKIVVDRLILDNPEIELVTDAQGRKSWEFAQLATGEPGRGPGSAPIRYAQARTGSGGAQDSDLPPEAREFLANATPSRPAGGGSAQGASLDGLQFGDVRIVNGRLRYRDEATGTAEAVDKLNVNLALEQIRKPLKADGNAVYKGETVAFEATLRTLDDIIANRPAKLVATIAGDKIAAGYDGSVTTGDVLRAEGAISADSPSLRGLMTWLGHAPAPSPGLQALSLKGRVAVDGPLYRVSRLTATLDGATATGDIAVRTDGARPSVTADLDLTTLDLNTYIPTGERPAAGSGGATRVKGSAQRDGWSTDPIDFTGLTSIDAKARLKVGRLLFKAMKADATHIDATLNNGTLRADMTQMQLYGGSGRGVLTLAAGKPADAELGATFAFDQVRALPLLSDAAELTWLDGTGRLEVALATRGGSEAQFVSALDGKASFDLKDGAVVGFNLSKYLRAISSGQFTDLKSLPNEKTDFSEMAATFDIQNGVARNNDLKLLSPLLRVGGEGEVSLPRRQIDYTVRPKLVSSLSGQGGETGLSGIEVPVRITGSFDDPKFKPDLGGILKDPSKAVDAVRELGKQFKGKNAGEIIDGLFGGGSSGSEGGGEKKIDGKKLLEGLFGR